MLLLIGVQHASQIFYVCFTLCFCSFECGLRVRKWDPFQMDGVLFGKVDIPC